MRRFWLIGLFLFAAVLAACSSSVGKSGEIPCRELEEIDSLMWKRADSAFVMLLDFAGSPKYDSLDEFNWHYCQLLVSELLYKNYYEQSNRQELLQALEYFDSLGDAYLDARAHYMNGVGFYEQGDIEEACKEYLKALALMDENFAKMELIGQKAQFMTCAYNRLGDMFSEQFMMESAITCYKNSCLYSSISPISAYSVSNALYRIGKQYHKKGVIDSADYYYSQALMNMPDTTNLFYRDIISNKALLSFLLTNQAEASVQSLKQLVSLTDDDDEKQTRFFVIGGIYFEAGLYDSARLYLEPVFENKRDIVVKTQAAQYLQTVFDSLGDSGKSDKYMRFLALQKQSEGQNKALVSQLESLFQYYQDAANEKQAKAERRKVLKREVGIVTSVSLLFLTVIIILLRQHVNAERQKHKLQQASLSGRLKRSNEELRQIKKLKMRKDDIITTAERAKSFEEEPVCRLIKERVNHGQFKSQIDYSVYKSYALDKEHMVALYEAANRHFCGFCTRLKETYPRLTYGDLDYCCLYLLGLNDADVSALMQKAYPTVSQRSRKIKAILGKEAPLAKTLRGFAEIVS